MTLYCEHGNYQNYINKKLNTQYIILIPIVIIIVKDHIVGQADKEAWGSRELGEIIILVRYGAPCISRLEMIGRFSQRKRQK